MKEVNIKIKQRISNIICLILCLNLLISLFVPMMLVSASSSQLRNSTYAVDPDTTDDYISHMINDTNGSRYAGRIWTDKTVLRNSIKLNYNTDGYSGTIANNSDFLHVFSALGSSQAWIGLPPSKTVIVIDNSGSMYGNNAEWEKTRIYKTIESVNKAIDILMRASQYNEVAVVLFGEGADSTVTEENSLNIHPYHGNSTATTILPMKHYTVSKNSNEPLKYLDSGWAAANDLPKADSLNHTTKSSGGWVFVNNEIAELNSDNTKENQKYNWFDSKKWNGWNNCGDRKYTTYRNGTTNIQAGMYQGMQELLKADKSLTIAGNEYNCVPSLVLLTDGAATDAISNWLNPEINEAGYISKSLGFVVDFSYNGNSFIGKNDTRGDKTNADRNGTSWNQFLAVKNKDGSAYSGGTNEESVLAKEDKVYYEAIASAYLNSNELLTFEQYNYKNKNGDAYTDEKGNTVASTHVLGPSLTAMRKLEKNYRNDEAYFVFTYLLTTSYYKQAVKNAYKVEDDWDIYTISVDMDDPSKSDFKAGFPKSETNEGNKFTSNPFMMDPGKYFNKKFLTDKGFLLNDSSDENNTYFDDETVGDKAVEGVLKAINAWDAFVNGDFEKWNKSDGITTYQRIQDGYNFDTNNIKGKIKVYKANEYNFDNSPGKGEVSAFELSKTGIDGKVYNFSEGGIYPGPNHGSFWRVYKEQKINEDFFIPTKSNDPNIDLTKLDYDYVTESYYAYSSSSGGDSIEVVFDTIVESIKKPAFTPTHDNFSKENTLSYSDPIGKYMEVKNVKNLLLFGKLYDVEKTDVKYVVVKDGEEKESSTKPSKYDYIRQYYQIKDKGNNEIVNDCYRVIDEADEYPSKVTFKLSDIKIYVDTNLNAGPLENDQTLYVEIPSMALPLQVVTIKLNPDGSSAYYKTNVADKKESTPLRLFYEVGISDSILFNNKKDIDLSKISDEYKEKYTKNDILSFNSNYYSNTLYDGYIADTQEDARTKGDAVLSISPSIENRYYIFQKHLKLYDYAYIVDEGGNVHEENEPLLFEGADFDGEYDGRTENDKPNAEGLASIKNAYQQGKLKKGDIIVLKGDVVKYGTNPKSEDFYYFAIDYYMPTSDGKGKKVQYVVARRGSEFGSGILQDEGNIIPKGDFLSWMDETGKNSEVYDYTNKIPDSKLKNGNWVLVTKIGGLRIGDLHQGILRKTKNNTGTSKSYYLPVISHANSSNGSDVTLSGYLGNNGLLTYKYIVNPNTSTTIIVLCIAFFTINAILLLGLLYRKKYFKKNKFQN